MSHTSPVDKPIIQKKRTRRAPISATEKREVICFLLNAAPDNQSVQRAALRLAMEELRTAVNNLFALRDTDQIHVAADAVNAIVTSVKTAQVKA